MTKRLSPTLRILVHGQIWIPKQIFRYCFSFRLPDTVRVKEKDQYSLPETNCILLASQTTIIICVGPLCTTRSSAQGISFENLLFTILPIILHFVTFIQEEQGGAGLSYFPCSRQSEYRARRRNQINECSDFPQLWVRHRYSKLRISQPCFNI